MIRARPAAECEFDVVSLGEVMLRLDPGDARLRDAQTFDVHIGGGEYNVAHAASNAFELRSAVATALVENEMGVLIRNRIRGAGVATDLIRWRESDGVGTSVRNGLNFTERGYGQRGALGVYDRGHTAASQLVPGDFDWDDLFGRRGVRWLHSGGVFASLSPTTAQLTLEAVEAANRWGTIVSFDVNHRPSLWRNTMERGGHASVFEEILGHVDLLFANHGDIARAVPGWRLPTDGMPPGPDSFRAMVEGISAHLPRLRGAATPVRIAHSASRNSWGGIGWVRDEGFCSVAPVEPLEIFDRVGGGDGFAAGLIYGALSEDVLAHSLALAIAHGALVMSTPGDTSSATIAEVRHLAEGGSPVTTR
ncbi:PfkB family carbohydrate kinase [Herbiconiux sp. YIM B11900]|uniref:PfkB family carbohydrate kinase n=1 Tax=Herbiconiux sp. YIM B11900 TaxID=3404131 RepID=UPI003F8461C2